MLNLLQFLDLISGLNVTQWTGWESISIISMQNADAIPRQWTSNRQPVVRVNCPATTCSLDNVYLQGVQQGVGDHPAVRVLGKARVTGVTILDALSDGALDVRDEQDRYAGNFVSRSAGGWTIVGEDSPSAENETSLKPNNGHALLLGRSSEAGARFALEHDGTMRWNSAAATLADDHGSVISTSAFETTVEPPRTATTTWPALQLAASASAGAASHSLPLTVKGVVPGDICTCSHDALGAEEVQLSCHTSATDTVLVVLRNAGATSIHIGSGTVRVLVTRVGDSTP